MSVVGFDVGNAASCVALARKRGIDVLLNKESNRETPAVANFGDKMRFLGTDGAAKLGLAPQNSVHQLKRLLGKKFSDPAVQADIAKLPFSVTEGPDGGCLINVIFCNEPATFTPEQVMAMIIVDLKKVAEMVAEITVTDCAMTVPTYYTERERYAMLNAAQIAGVNCLRLMNETTATALAYGIYKTDLPDNEAVHVAFVDVGHTAVQVSIVALKKNQLIVKSHAWDRNLGGRDLDEALYEHFATEWQAKTKLDLRSNKKGSFKMRMACEKLKKVLSVNPEAPINVECLMEDTDFRGFMTRDTLEQLAAPVLDRLKGPMQRALDLAGLTAEDISSVELVGGSTRVPAIVKAVEDVYKKAPSRTMNAKECVCRGAALQCAMLSPVFKVREFEVIDACPHNIQFTWEKDGAPFTQTLFKRGEAFPSTKLISFNRSAPFTVTAHYSEDSDVPNASDRALGVYSIGPFTVPPGAESAKLKVKISLNLHGLIQVESVQSVEEYEDPEPPAPKDIKMEDAAAASAAADAAAGPAPMETDAAAAAGAPAAAEAAKQPKPKKVKRTDVPFTAAGVAGYTSAQLADYFEKEHQMQAADKLQEETNERKNALEGYVYALRNKLYDVYSDYIKPEDKEALLARLQAMEDWLYEEGEDTTKSVYIAKLDELKKFGAPVELRYSESQSRPAAVESLREVCNYYLGAATSDKPQYAHIGGDERGSVIKEAQAALSWLDEKLALQASQPKTDDPMLVTADIIKKRDTVERVCKPIMSKPAPPPPKPAAGPAPQPAASDAAGTSEATPMESDTNGGSTGAEAEAAAAASAGDEQTSKMETSA